MPNELMRSPASFEVVSSLDSVLFEVSPIEPSFPQTVVPVERLGFADRNFKSATLYGGDGMRAEVSRRYDLYEKAAYYLLTSMEGNNEYELSLIRSSKGVDFEKFDIDTYYNALTVLRVLHSSYCLCELQHTNPGAYALIWAERQWNGRVITPFEIENYNRAVAIIQQGYAEYPSRYPIPQPQEVLNVG